MLSKSIKKESPTSLSVHRVMIRVLHRRRVERMSSKSIKKESPTSLSVHRVMRGIIWVFSQRIADQGFRFIKTIFLARILAPKDFGLMGVALLAISALDAFSQTGLRSALIQRKENTDNYLDSAWTVSVFRGLAIFVVLYIASP